MNITNHKYRLSLVVIVLLFSNQLFCQDSEFNQEELFQVVEQKYGTDQVLVNGRYFENIYIHDLGHPYFAEDEFSTGYLVIHDKKYDGLLLKYDIYNQHVLVQHKAPSGAQIVFIPPVDFISEFGIHQRIFRKYKFADQEQFYEEIYSGTVGLLCYWKKDRDESEYNASFMAHKFSKPYKKYFLFYGDALHYIKNKNALLKLFPAHKKSISQFMKEHDIKLAKASNKKLAELTAYCESLIQENNNQKIQ